MKLVIDIPEEDYDFVKKQVAYGITNRTLQMCIANGIPLPPSHGKLMILSEDKLKEDLIDVDFSCQKWISEVSLANATVKIIEAEKSQERSDKK